MPSIRPFGWLLVISFVSVAALPVRAETSNPSIQEDLAEVAQLGKEAQNREAEYLSIDYASIRNSEPKSAYNYALRINEASLTLSTIYRYARYDRDVAATAVDLIQTRAAYPGSTAAMVTLPENFTLPKGIATKRKDLEEDFIASLPNDVLAVRDLFEWQRTMWLGRLANYAQALAKIDGEMKRRHKAKDKAGELKAKEALNALLQQEPVLGINVTLGDGFTFGSGDKRMDMSFRHAERPLYAWLNDVYQLPLEQTRCTINCPVLNYIGWSENQARSARQVIQRENDLVELYGKKVLKRVLAAQESSPVEDGKVFIPLSTIFQEELSEFPLGGVAGYFTYLAQLQEMDEKNSDARYDLKVKDEVAYTILQPALKKLIQTLKKDLPKISNRSLWDYHGVPQLRSYVLSTLPPAIRTASLTIDNNEIAHRKPYLQRPEALLDGFYVLSLVAQSIIKPQSGVPKTLWWIGVRIAQGFYVASRFIIPSLHAQHVAEARSKTGLVTYETLSLAQAQVSAAYTSAWLLFFELPIRYDYLASRFINFIPKLCRSPFTQLHAFEFSLPTGEVVKGTLLRSGRWVQTAVGKMAASYGNIGQEVVKIATATVKGRPGEAIQILKTGILGEAAWNASTSLAVQGASERINRGPSFASQQGFWTNMVITGAVDGATGFYAYAKDMTAGQAIFSHGSTIFTMSILCQLGTGTPWSGAVPQRAMYETIYILTLSPWKFRYAKGIRDLGLEKLPQGGPVTRGVFMFKAKDWRNLGQNSGREAYSLGIGMGNNFIGNSIYTLGTMKIFEGMQKIPTETPMQWWIPHEEIPFWKKPIRNVQNAVQKLEFDLRARGGKAGLNSSTGD